MAALLSGARPGQVVVDYCAGNGGKALGEREPPVDRQGWAVAVG